MAPSPGAAGFAELPAERGAGDQFFERGGELRRPVRRYQKSGDPVGDGFAHATDRVPHDGQAMRGGFEVYEAEGWPR